MNEFSHIESRTRIIGGALYASMKNEVPSFFDKKKWSGRLMEWAMKDEALKLRLFRFIDVLPSLKTDALVVRLLNEYFSDMGDLPLFLRQGLRRISRGRLLPYAAGRVIRSGAESLARQFIAGNDAQDARKIFEALHAEGAEVSIDLLGEVVVSEAEAKKYAEEYIRLLNDLLAAAGGAKNTSGKDKRPAVDVSLKVSSFYSQLDPVDWEGSIQRAKEALKPVLKAAQHAGVSVTFDMEHYHLRSLIIAIFRSIVEDFEDLPPLGIAIQAYLPESGNDLAHLAKWAGSRKTRIAVRLVKGAYWDYEYITSRQRGWPVPVFFGKEKTDRNFEDLSRMLMENSEFIYPQIATHNLRSASHALAVAESLGLGRAAFEFQMLYGMAEPLRGALLSRQQRVRVYTPLGKLIPGMAYLIRRLLENTSNESFLRRSFEKTSFDDLIRRPEPCHGQETGTNEKRFRNEPALDFSIPSNRNEMSRALGKTKEGFGRRYPLVIAGREVYTEKTIMSVNPSRPAESVGLVSSGDHEHAEQAVSAAKKAWESWRCATVAERAGLLFRAARIMRRRRFDIAAAEVYEVGKAWQEADSDVAEAIDYCEYYGREMIRIGQKFRLGDYPGEENEYIYEPKGTGVVISPWNFPAAIPAGMIAAALVTGNCVIFKPSGLSPVTASLLVEVFREAGVPAGVLQYLPGPGGELGDYLVSHAKIDFIAFTGSREVGLRIIGRAGKTVPGQRNVKRVIAELGGKNAIIIDETADLDEAVMGVLQSAFGYQGQKCSACSRVIIVGNIFEDFTGRFREAADSIRIGNPDDPSSFMGPVIDQTAYERILHYIERGNREGRTVLQKRAGRNGFFVGPAVFADLDGRSPLLREEIFGPVLALIRADTIDQALDMANDSDYALTGGVYSRSPENIRRVKEDFRVGNLYINRKITGALVGRQPFGGFGMSGIGSKAGGPDYLMQFLNPKTVAENTIRKGFAPLSE